jgi:hypothetical protein
VSALKNSLVAAATMLAGCAAHPTIYTWGSYEQGIYASYLSRNDFPAEKQIEQLEQDYQQAQAKNQLMPPGWHAHLGYLYFLAGKSDQARQEFMTEKAQFPESSVFMDRLLANLGKAT